MKTTAKLCKTAILFAFVLFPLIFGCSHVSASVYTTSNDAGTADTVYVAGNPNCFPLEYYSKEDEAFRGVIPDMLNAVSEKTGVSFTYISASSDNRQKELSRNNQVELVTALKSDGNECKVEEMLPILEFTTEGHRETYYIGFTEIASPDLVNKLEGAFSELSEQEKMGFLLANAQRNPEIDSKNRLIKIILIIVGSVLALVCIIIVAVAKKRKHNSFDTQIDEETGVGNEKYYTYAFEQLLSRQSKNLYAVIYLAADTESIIAKYGEKSVAEIERYAAVRLNAAIASAEYLAKVNSGVFVLLIQAVTEKECENKVCDVVNNLNGYIQEFYPDMNDCFKAGVSRLCDHPDCDAETAFYNARQGYLSAVGKDKAVGISGEKNLAQSKKRERLRRSISKAVAGNEFRVYLQLIAESNSGKICGAEVLSRWQNAEYGILQPQEYIEILKETGEIVNHDYKMFAAACRQLETWSVKPYDKLFLTCNFTRISLSQDDFFNRISEISSAFKFDRDRLVLEVTEDSIAENSKVVSQNICKCRETGFRIAIDDIGTGFSSFSDLYDNEIDLVKIYGGFIGSCTSERRKTMLSDIISLVHHSGAKVLCEGVENLSQAEFLKKIECDMMQGFYFSKILPQAECAKFLKTETVTEIPVFQKQ